MDDWIDAIGDAIFHICDLVARPATARQAVAMLCFTFAAFFAVVAVVALALGNPLPAPGSVWGALSVPCLFMIVGVSVNYRWPL